MRSTTSQRFNTGRRLRVPRIAPRLAASLAVLGASAAGTVKYGCHHYASPIGTETQVTIDASDAPRADNSTTPPNADKTSKRTTSAPSD